MATKKNVTRKSASKTASKSASESRKVSETKSNPQAKKTVKAKTALRSGAIQKQTAKPKMVAASSANLLARAEEDMGKLLESLNTQMSAAMSMFSELAAAQRGKHEAVIRTKPLDRATAMFQRLVNELVDDRIGEVLPTVVALRNEMEQRAQAAQAQSSGDGLGEFFTRGTEMLDQVLTNLDVIAFQPKTGEAFDPLIHLAIGETNRSDLADDVVSEVFQPGFRSVRGKVVLAARVKVNRR